MGFVGTIRRSRAQATRALLGVLAKGYSRECNICGWTGAVFMPLRHPRVAHFDSSCPRCGSKERHRLAKLVTEPLLPRDAELLHFAAEPCLQPWLRGAVGRYVSADLFDTRAELKLDLQAIDLPDASFDVVWCSHVLEHVADDLASMREIYRVLRPGGFAMIQVPRWRILTDEDNTVTDPSERERRFLQHDHLRIYGMDIVDRLAETGFSVEVCTPLDYDPGLIFHHQVAQVGNMEVFICRKRAAN